MDQVVKKLTKLKVKATEEQELKFKAVTWLF